MTRLLAMNQIGIQLEFGPAVHAIKAAGYGGIGIWYDSLYKFGYERGKRELRESGLVNCVACFIGFFNQTSEAEYRRARDEDIRKIRQASDLGALSVLAVSGPQGSMRQDEADRQVVRALNELGPVAAEVGVKIALESIHHMYRDDWTFITTLKQALRIVEQVDHPSVGLMFDTYHLWQEPGLLDTIQSAKGRFVGAQVNDWRPITRSGNDRGIMGEGCIPLGELLTAVERAGFADWYDVEIFSDELWKLDPTEFLRRCKAGWNTVAF
jgi:sugar phosphate isomerase/epimerase